MWFPCPFLIFSLYCLKGNIFHQWTSVCGSHMPGQFAFSSSSFNTRYHLIWMTNKLKSRCCLIKEMNMGEAYPQGAQGRDCPWVVCVTLKWKRNKEIPQCTNGQAKFLHWRESDNLQIKAAGMSICLPKHARSYLCATVKKSNNSKMHAIIRHRCEGFL